jgi:hypothetical protein
LGGYLDAQTAEDEYICVADAVKLIFDDNTATQADTNVEQAALNRVTKWVPVNSEYAFSHKYLRYPAALSQHIHRAKVHLPVDVGRALSVDPSLVQRAVEAFYTRDGLQLRVGSS